MPTPDDVVLLDVKDGIARIRFNRPAALNALDDGMARGFLSACEVVSRQSDLRVIVLSGAGRAFMAGGDVRRMHEAGADAAPVIGALLDLLNPALLLLANLEVPVIASLRGAVAGGVAQPASQTARATQASRCQLPPRRRGPSGGTPADGQVRVMPSEAERS